MSTDSSDAYLQAVSEAVGVVVNTKANPNLGP